jgi:hypothetical protein
MIIIIYDFLTLNSITHRLIIIVHHNLHFEVISGIIMDNIIMDNFPQLAIPWFRIYHKIIHNSSY